MTGLALAGSGFPSKPITLDQGARQGLDRVNQPTTEVRDASYALVWYRRASRCLTVTFGRGVAVTNDIEWELT